MAPTLRILMATAVLAGAFGVSAPASAQFNFLFGGRATSDFSSEDWSMFKDAMRQVLDRGKVGSRTDWKNEKTGYHGDMAIDRVYERQGLSCRHVKFSIVRAKDRTPYRMNFCKTDQGDWVIAP